MPVSLHELREFAKKLTDGSLFKEATLLVIEELEKRVQCRKTLRRYHCEASD
jgi:hypothetical protein